MAADVKTQTSVLRKNSSDYPQYSELESATIASDKTLGASGRQHSERNRVKNRK